MTFLPRNLTQNLRNNLEGFVRNNDFVELYREYSWGIDNWRNGFPNILQLETRITSVVRNNLLRKEYVLAVAEWGNLRNMQRVTCPETIILPIFENEHLNMEIDEDPAFLLRILQDNIKGFGPTYLSKVLRFILPSEFGAIDSRIVRVVGEGDLHSRQQNWLSLRVRNDGYGWYITRKQPAWPDEYSTWINILRFFAHFLKNSGEYCPHPKGFLTNNLRTQDTWECADIEMALFSYASQNVN